MLIKKAILAQRVIANVTKHAILTTQLPIRQSSILHPQRQVKKKWKKDKRSVEQQGKAK